MINAAISGKKYTGYFPIIKEVKRKYLNNLMKYPAA
jgi:hypothetical protein